MNVIALALGILWAAGGLWFLLAAAGTVSRAKSDKLTPEVRANWRRSGLQFMFGGLVLCVLSFVI